MLPFRTLKGVTRTAYPKGRGDRPFLEAWYDAVASRPFTWFRSAWDYKNMDVVLRLWDLYREVVVVLRYGSIECCRVSSSRFRFK